MFLNASLVLVVAVAIPFVIRELTAPFTVGVALIIRVQTTASLQCKAVAFGTEKSSCASNALAPAAANLTILRDDAAAV